MGLKDDKQIPDEPVNIRLGKAKEAKRLAIEAGTWIEPDRSKSLRHSINMMCKQCIFDPHGGEGNWRQQITKCGSVNCPLYGVRPRSKPGK
jgi:hypothetical protein